MFRALCGVGLLVVAGVLAAGEQEMELDGTSIRGDKEQPKVLYVVPWQDPEAHQRKLDHLPGLAGDLFKPLDRPEFRREVAYRQGIRRAGKSSTVVSN